MHSDEMIFGHSELEPQNDFDMGSAMLGPLPPVYVCVELGALAKVFALQLKQIVAGYSRLRSESGFGMGFAMFGALPPVYVSFGLGAWAVFLAL